eukprot:521689_1
MNGTSIIFLVLSFVGLQCNQEYRLYHYDLKHKDDLLSNCTEYFYGQYIDHFNYQTGPTPGNITTYMQRYYICGGSNWKQNDPIFFYTGNEGNVELYINYTGLMWENQDRFNAIMIFAERRYFGKSLIFTEQQLKDDPELYRFVVFDQVLADYARLIYYLKTEQLNSWNSKVIGFGGSLGGEYCAWFRIKYPQWMYGCISGSAPIFDYEGIHPPTNPKAAAQIMTLGASTAGGTNDLCKNNIRKAWDQIFNLTQTQRGRNQLSHMFNLCSNLSNESIARGLPYWIVNGINTMTESSFPYPSAYMTGTGELPAYPLQYGCDKYMLKNFSNSVDILYALSDIMNILFNVTQDVQCYDIDENILQFMPGYIANDKGGWMTCTVLFMRGTFNDINYSSDGIDDMFWDNTWNASQWIDLCYKNLGIKPRSNWVALNFGGTSIQYDGVKNIVFSSAVLDPWAIGRVYFNNSKNGIYAVSTGMVGHHMDLMFSTDLDPQSVINVREFELQQIANWINQKIIK